MKQLTERTKTYINYIVIWYRHFIYNTCGLQLKEDDIFDKTSFLIKSLRNGEEVDATDFGPIMSPGVNSSKAVYDVKKYFYLQM